jgi:hypothetical protein
LKHLKSLLIIFSILFNSQIFGQVDSNSILLKSHIAISAGYASKISDYFKYNGYALGLTLHDKLALDYIFLTGNYNYDVIYTQAGIFELYDAINLHSFGFNFFISEYEKKFRVSIGSSIIFGTTTREKLDFTKPTPYKETSIEYHFTRATLNFGFDYKISNKFKLNFTTLNFNSYSLSLKYQLSQMQYKKTIQKINHRTKTKNNQRKIQIY